MAHGSNEPSRDAREATLAGSDDRGYGLVMFVVFSAAVLFMTGTVALLALVGSWWMLGAAFAVHAGTTAFVTFVVIHAMGEASVALPPREGQDVRGAPRRRVWHQGAGVTAH